MPISRRHWLQSGGLASLMGISACTPKAAETASGPTVYQRLGLRPILNFRGTHTTLGASKQWQECFQAQAEAAREYIVLEELQEAIGERLAKLCGTESAMVSTGAAGAIAIGTYACVAGDDPFKIRQLPNLDGMKNEVIIQKCHRISYDHAVRGAGVKIVEVETLDQLKAAVNDNTAMVYFLPANNDDYDWGDWVRIDDVLAVTKPAGVPVLADCANMLPPWKNIPDFAASGCDLLAISGGKHMRGPQSTGILAGPKEMVRKAWLNSNPHSDSQGRPMKVDREGMVALWTACEIYSQLDFEKINAECERQAQWLKAELEQIPALRVEMLRHENARKVHRIGVWWDEAKVGKDRKTIEAELMDGDPRIAVAGAPDGGLAFCVFMNEPGEEQLVAKRMQELFT
ncbi:MAG: aminotransferase class V-fold PLP-dependent enzyme [Acidobacteria bacterium]|nr:aminotransferase class V-fold PLP-dependent enzyme [Acidobacteriota bacterium]